MELTGKEFWSWNDFRHGDISVRGEDYTFEIFELNDEITKHFENPPKSFFENYPTKKFSYSKWRKTPILNSENEKLEFVTPLYVNWNDRKRKKIEAKQEIVKRLAKETGSYYVIDTIIGKDVTFYLISPKAKVFVYINHNM